ILHETSYDRYNQKADRIYRVTRSFNNPDGAVTLKLSTIAPAFGPLLQNYFPDIQQITRFLPNGKTPIKYEEKLFNEDKLFFADEHAFDVFDINVVEGNPKKALEDPFSVMLSEKIAKKYFGGTDPMNKVIRMNNQFDVKVTGVFKSFPSNAHIHPELMVSFNTLKDSAVYGAKNLETNFGNNSFFTYLLLPINYPAKNIEAQFPAFLDRDVHFQGAPAGFKPSTRTRLGLQKLTDIHLTSHTDYEAEENGDISRVYIFSAIALIILLIACINYMNLSTARSALRAKEIGIRKVSGAGKGVLITQFLSESVLITGIALLFALAMTYLTLPLLNRMIGLELAFNQLFSLKYMVLICFTPFMVGVLAGIYPALFLSSFQPVKTLKGLFKTGGKSISFRKALVVTQFGISIVLIITTAIVFQQLKYMQQAKLGYNKEHVVVLPYYFTSDSQYETYRNELLSNAGILNMGRSSRIPTGRLLDSQGASAESGDSLQPVTVELKYLATDYDFLPSYSINMAAGRNFSRAFATDTANFVVNEAAVNVLGWKSPATAVGKNFMYGGVKGKIIGVTKDFHFESMHQKIAPIVMTLPKPDQANRFNQLSIKLDGKNLPGELASIEKIWRHYLPQ
ncbi:MAG: ABC transporter permease, partial [Bacteroidota bacterium]|nr:ABC transporter permease [Bacteroidota bacterium]